MGLLWKFDRFFLPLRKKNKKKNPVPSGHNTNMCNWDRETEKPKETLFLDRVFNVLGCMQKWAF